MVEAKLRIVLHILLGKVGLQEDSFTHFPPFSIVPLLLAMKLLPSLRSLHFGEEVVRTEKFKHLGISRTEPLECDPEDVHWSW